MYTGDNTNSSQLHSIYSIRFLPLSNSLSLITCAQTLIRLPSLFELTQERPFRPHRRQFTRHETFIFVLRTLIHLHWILLCNVSMFLLRFDGHLQRQIVHRNEIADRRSSSTRNNVRVHGNDRRSPWLVGVVRVSFTVATFLLVILAFLSAVLFVVDLFLQSVCRFVHEDRSQLLSFIIGKTSDCLSADGLDLRCGLL